MDPTSIATSKDAETNSWKSNCQKRWKKIDFWKSGGVPFLWCGCYDASLRGHVLEFVEAVKAHMKSWGLIWVQEAAWPQGVVSGQGTYGIVMADMSSGGRLASVGYEGLKHIWDHEGWYGFRRPPGLSGLWVVKAYMESWGLIWSSGGRDRPASMGFGHISL